MPQSQQTCPICNRPVPPFERYPRYVCADCAGRVTSPDGRPLKFFNESLSGGYLAFYADDGTPYNSHECVIDGIRCYADEARFGGIVIQVV
jgi:hypothetical protein